MKLNELVLANASEDEKTFTPSDSSLLWHHEAFQACLLPGAAQGVQCSFSLSLFSSLSVECRLIQRKPFKYT